MEGPRLVRSKELCVYTIVSRKYAPPFAILALVQNARGGGLYVGCHNFSRNYALPSGKA